MKELLGLSCVQLRALATDLGEPSYRGDQLDEWLHRKLSSSFDAMSNLPAPFRKALSENFCVGWPEVEADQKSEDGTQKFLLRLADGERIEAVAMPSERYMTFCLSTQAGCAMACGFCATAKMGAKRSLTAGEILGQVFRLKQECGIGDVRDGERLHILFMGMGEPLLNYEAVMEAFRRLNNPEDLGISHRNITLSTVGIIPGIERLGTEEKRPNLAVSLNATTDTEREALIPINVRYPIENLMQTLEQFPRKQGGGDLTIEYLLISGINDSAEDAKRLKSFAHRVSAKINLIAWNAVSGLPYKSPSLEEVARFQDKVYDESFPVLVRRPRGLDIDGACGQLRVMNK